MNVKLGHTVMANLVGSTILLVGLVNARPKVDAQSYQLYERQASTVARFGYGLLYPAPNGSHPHT